MLWKHLIMFEMNLMNIKYPKHFKNSVANAFTIQMTRDLKWFENDMFMINTLYTSLHKNKLHHFIESTYDT